MDGDLRNHELLRSYLLGELPEEEMDRLEQGLIEDDELFALCEALEGDLLAACDRGELTAAEKEQVHRRLAATPAGRERLALARSLNTAAREPRWKTALLLPFRRFVPLPRLASGWAALAAAVLLVAVGTWFVVPALQKDGPPHRPIKIVKRGSQAETRDSGRIKGPEPKHEVQPPPTKPDRAPQRDERATAKPPVRHEPVKTVFALSLTTLRGAEDVQKFPIPPNAELVEIKGDLEGLEEYKSFHAAVRQGNATVWEKGGLVPKRLKWGRDIWGTALVLKIPAQRFTTGRYKLVVSAGAEELASQDFEVVRE